MKVDYLSDLHLEFLDYPNFSGVEGGDVLILAGDITTASMLRENRTDKDARSHKKYLKKFKTDLLDKYRHVFYVMGNHEHYNSIFGKTSSQLHLGFQQNGLTNITIFDNHFAIVDDVVFVGSTLWSDFEKGNDLAMYRCEKGMNDFRLIGKMDVEDITHFNKKSSRLISSEFILSEFEKSKKHIEDTIRLFSIKKIVVFTHHGPTYKSLNSIHIGNGLDGAYASDLSELILKNPQIKYWVSGHCHSIKDYKVGECEVLQNCRGYEGEPCYYEFAGPKTFIV
jgi:Icc-related predicted phosphoesterase